MYGRWFDVTVVLLWIASMSWLVVTKVAPSLFIGDPPPYSVILAAQREESPVGWLMEWDDRPVGWAVITTTPMPQGLTEVRSRVHFDNLPLNEMMPEWLRGVLPRFGKALIQADSRSIMVFDPLGHLSRFETAVSFQQQEPFVKIRGTIDAGKLAIWIRVGDIKPYEMTVPVPREAIQGDTLSPQSRLPELREGQKWTMETYSPLRPPTDPREILCATVDSRASLVWDRQLVNAFLVVYRSDPGAAIGSAGSVRAKLWVHQDGRVLKEQIMVLNSTLSFFRMTPRNAARVAAMLDEENIGSPQGQP